MLSQFYWGYLSGRRAIRPQILANLKLGVLHTSENDSTRPLDRVCRYEPTSPIASENEEEVDTSRIELLRRAAPALVSTVGRDTYLPALMSSRGLHLVGRGLDLNPEQPIIELRHQVDIRAMSERNPDECTLARRHSIAENSPRSPWSFPRPAYAGG